MEGENNCYEIKQDKVFVSEAAMLCTVVTIPVKDIILDEVISEGL